MVQSFAQLAAEIEARSRAKPHFVVAVDGRSASGKSTFAQRLARALNAPIVHTDDVAWHHSFFDWWPLMIEQILLPFEAGHVVQWTPEAWTAKGRVGAIEVLVSPILIIEGVSSSRLELHNYLDLAIWIETDPAVAEQRGLERDGPQARDFWFEWQAAEVPFLECDKPWERAQVIVDGASSVALNPQTEFVRLENQHG